MRKRVLRLAALGAVVGGVFLATAPAAFADAATTNIGPIVSGAAQTAEPNFGLAVCKPAATTGTENDAALTLLGHDPSHIK